MKKEESYMKQLLTIAVVLFKIGCCTFGGGWSIVAQMEYEFTARRNYITQKELMDDVALGKSLPGIMIINTVVIFGYQVLGVAGAFVAAVSLSLPALISIAAVTFFYNSLRHNVLVARILTGVRCAVVPIIISAGFKLKGGSITTAWAWVLAVVSFILCGFTGIGKFLVVAGGGVAGYFLFGPWGRCSFGDGKEGA